MRLKIEKYKIYLKRFWLVYSINAFFKSLIMKHRRFKIINFYAKKIATCEKRYQEADAIGQFQKRHHDLNINFSPKKAGDLNFFWVGASQAQDESGFLQALLRLGTVSRFYNSHDEYGPHYALPGLDWLQVRRVNDSTLLEQVKRAHAVRKIDCLIGQMWAHVYSEAALLSIRRFGIPIINIAMDDRLPELWLSRRGQRMGSVGLASGVDITLTTAAETCDWYAVEQMPAIFWPLASDKDLFATDHESPRDIDILFIGNRYGIRGQLVEYLARHGVLVTCFGHGWPNGYANAEQNVALSKRAKIILGIGTVGHCSDIYTLKLRDFDALMTGALYITHRNPDLIKLFTEGEHIECYEDANELLNKLKYYLAHPDVCAAIGKKAQVLAQSKYSWDYRLTTTCRQLGLLS